MTAPIPAAPSVDDLLCFAVYSAGLAFNQFYRPLLSELGLTYPQYLVMLSLAAKDDQTVTEIGQTLHLEFEHADPASQTARRYGSHPPQPRHRRRTPGAHKADRSGHQPDGSGRECARLRLELFEPAARSDGQAARRAPRSQRPPGPEGLTRGHHPSGRAVEAPARTQEGRTCGAASSAINPVETRHGAGSVYARPAHPDTNAVEAHAHAAADSDHVDEQRRLAARHWPGIMDHLVIVNDVGPFDARVGDLDDRDRTVLLARLVDRQRRVRRIGS